MEGTGKKENFILACIKHQEDAAKNAQLLMEEAQQAANDYGAPKDRYDSFRTKQMRTGDMYASQLDNALQNVRTLQLIDANKKSNRVEFGSIVTTDKQTMFVSVSLGKLECAGEEFYAISVKVPIYVAMKDKKEGDVFVCNGIKHKIISIL